MRALTTLALALVIAAALAAAPASAATPVALDARLHRAAVPVGGDGINHLRVLLTADRVKLDKRMPLNVVLVVDRSGSMSGDKIRNVREAAKFVVGELQAGDVLAVLSFSSSVRAIQPAALVETLDRDQVKAAIDRLRDSGSTNMLAAMREGLAQASVHASSDRVNRIILLSDGRPDKATGLTEIAAEGLRKGVFLTTMGVGRDYNEDLMAKLADSGSGAYYFIEKATDIVGIFQRELRDLMAVVAREGVVRLDLAPGVALEQVYGYESSDRKGRVSIPVGDLFGGGKADILVRLKTTVATAAEGSPVAAVTFSFHDAVADRSGSLETKVVQEVSADRARVKSGIDPEVGGKVARVAAAEAKKDAMRLYEAGRSEEARRRLETGARALRGMGGRAAPKAAVAAEAAELESLGDAMQAPAASSSGKALRKSTKKAARDALR